MLYRYDQVAKAVLSLGRTSLPVEVPWLSAITILIRDVDLLQGCF